jgi:hypothetical protein
LYRNIEDEAGRWKKGERERKRKKDERARIVGVENPLFAQPDRHSAVVSQ